MRDEHTEYSCAAALAIEVLQGKWRIQILCVMREGPVRLGKLGRLIPSASKKVLTENLRKLESAGLVIRTDMSGQIRHVEYDLAESFKLGTHELLDHLAKWGDVYDAARLVQLRRPIAIPSIEAPDEEASTVLEKRVFVAGRRRGSDKR
jgi:DNA-binding HxlR family transcriptional regulator